MLLSSTIIQNWPNTSGKGRKSGRAHDSRRERKLRRLSRFIITFGHGHRLECLFFERLVLGLGHLGNLMWLMGIIY